ncbi:hypothetical protein [Mycobacterium sp. SMC-4]|uniref:hypothetical protein n=1 Tax=Mycobacterium sp. SMC-4 TaxID=2857059 RepID=UPI0021B41E00|nr:hypothetical protein [Mycobacterium sp. SMC-4]UXA18754.1 hypothetical protein KXD98_03370 [Mycobacterium sp. SMC-4]
MAAIEISHPPGVILRTLNPVLRRVLRTPLGGRLTELMVVSFRGRKSGRQFEVPVSAHHLDGDLYVVLEAQWKHNFRDGADAEVTYQGQTTPMTGVLITDRAAVTDVAHRLTASYGAKKAQRMMGLKFADGRVPTQQEWTEAVDRLGIAAVKLTPKA